jgi:hypothetical protein
MSAILVQLAEVFLPILVAALSAWSTGVVGGNKDAAAAGRLTEIKDAEQNAAAARPADRDAVIARLRAHKL